MRVCLLLIILFLSPAHHSHSWFIKARKDWNRELMVLYREKVTREEIAKLDEISFRYGFRTEQYIS